LKTKKTKNKRINKGSSLVEALISIALISFVIVSILSGFAQQQHNTSRTTDKNTAVMLAEMRMEEFMKFPSGQLDAKTYVDYIVPKPNGFKIYGENDPIPSQLRQFKREAEIKIEDIMGQLATITVTVEYGAVKQSVSSNTLIYPFRITLTSRRSLK
jgi:type II secretory pathway pseudopilin PulG